MLQAVIKKGGVEVTEVSIPMLESKNVLIKLHYSCVSFGTESTTVKNSGKSIIQKAKEKPEKVKKVVDKLLAEGVKSTLSMVNSELNVSTPTGYSVAGEVIQVGSLVKII